MWDSITSAASSLSDSVKSTWDDVAESTSEIVDKLTGGNGDIFATKKFVYPHDLDTDGHLNYILFNINTTDGSEISESKDKKVENQGSLPSSIVEALNIHKGGSSSSIAATALGGEKRSEMYIALYMPENISHSTGHTWDATEIGLLGRTLDFGGKVTDGDIDAATNHLNEGAKQLITNTIQSVSPLQVQDLKDLKNQTLTNPYLEVLYKGTEHRTHSFEFKFTPKNAKESETVKNIINRFRFYSAPDFNKNNHSQLKYPSTFDITFMHHDKLHPFLSQATTCALTVVDVDYSAAGKFAVHDDGTPVEVKLGLTFIELEQLTKSRIKEGF